MAFIWSSHHGPDENQDDKPIALKKLKQGNDMWDTMKEILVWLFNGIGRCIQLPSQKVTMIIQMMKDILCSQESSWWY